MKELRGKNVLLTGGSYGLGVHIAKSLALAGTNLMAPLFLTREVLPGMLKRGMGILSLRIH